MRRESGKLTKASGMAMQGKLLESVLVQVPTQPQQKNRTDLEAETTLIDRATPRRTHQEWANRSAFAAINADGSVTSWGSIFEGGDSSNVADQISSGVVRIHSTRQAFAAIKDDGSVVAWGRSTDGGNSSAVSDQLAGEHNNQPSVIDISSTLGAFAAIRNDGSVVTWGSSFRGGNSNGVTEHISSGVTDIFSTQSAFAALKRDGSVITWGDSDYGGDSSAVASDLTGGVVKIFANDYAFSALKQDGSVVTWGLDAYGGRSLEVSDSLNNVSHIYTTDSAFAALKEDGSVVCWGLDLYGGNPSESIVQLLSSGVSSISSTRYAFAALKDDGSVITWDDVSGGDSSGVSEQLQSGVTSLFATEQAFAALKNDGSVVSWGSIYYGGDSTDLQSELSSGVHTIVPNGYAFSALKNDGSVLTWGGGNQGGDISSVADELSDGVTDIYGNEKAFVAIKNDGSVVSWGAPNRGGDSSEANFRGGSPSIATPLSELNISGKPIDDFIDTIPVPTPTPSPDTTTSLGPTPTPESTPIPSATPTPESTPVPSATPTPESTPAPSATPDPSIDKELIDDFANNSSTSGVVVIGDVLYGNLESIYDDDWFKVSLTKGSVYRFDLEGIQLNDPRMSLYGSNLQELTYDDDGGSGYDSLIEFTATSSDNYFISAKSWGETGTYTLKATDITPAPSATPAPEPTPVPSATPTPESTPAPSATPDPSIDQELIDDFANNSSTSGVVVIGGVVNGNLESIYDDDWFKVPLTKGSVYRFDLEGIQLNDPRMSLHGSNLQELTYDDDGGSGYDSLIEFTATSSDNYFISAKSWGETGTYALKATDITPAPSATPTPEPTPLPSATPTPESTPEPEPYDVIIQSVRGKGKLKGTKVADAFTFDSFEPFTKKAADKIIGFEASQGDTIAVSPDAFPALVGVSAIRFASTRSKKEFKQMSKEDYDFVYFEKKGRLYFDGNGSAKNWGNSGEGGLVAILKGKPDLTAEDLTLLA
ncbi:peptidase [Synechococcus sp. A18-46.1]|nr:peptidase [Synechococcus sp. A18-46.1]